MSFTAREVIGSELDFDELMLPVAFMDVLKTCSMLSSWPWFAKYDFDSGRVKGIRCERVRNVASSIFNGRHVVLPELTKEMGGGTGRCGLAVRRCWGENEG